MSRYDFISTDRPVNKTASRVLQRGDDFRFEQPDGLCQTTPIQTVPFTGPNQDDNLTARFWEELKREN